MAWWSNLFGKKHVPQIETSEPKRLESKQDPSSLKSVSLADAVAPNKSGKPVFSSWSAEKAVKEGLKASSWVYTCVYKVAKAVASVPVVVETYDAADGRWDAAPNHELFKLLERPNEFWSWQDLVERSVIFLELTGNSVISKVRAGKRVKELWVLSPDMVKPIPHDTRYLAGYEYSHNRQKQVIPNEDIIHFMFTDPGNTYWGMSPMQAAARVIDTETEAVEWNKVALENRAVSDGILSFKHDLTADQWEEARNILRSQHMGSRGARMPWVLGNEASWQTISMSPVEMDFMNTRRMTREEICAIFGVPPVLVGILDRATYSNFETARFVFWTETIVPLISDLEKKLNLQLANEYDNTRIRFAVEDVGALSRLTTANIQAAQILYGMGVPFNEINQSMGLGLNDIPGGDKGYLNSGLVPSDMFDGGSLGLPGTEEEGE